jgi:hypothetical protein
MHTEKGTDKEWIASLLRVVPLFRVFRVRAFFSPYGGRLTCATSPSSPW